MADLAADETLGEAVFLDECSLFDTEAMVPGEAMRAHASSSVAYASSGRPSFSRTSARETAIPERWMCDSSGMLCDVLYAL